MRRCLPVTNIKFVIWPSSEIEAMSNHVAFPFPHSTNNVPEFLKKKDTILKLEWYETDSECDKHLKLDPKATSTLANKTLRMNM